MKFEVNDCQLESERELGYCKLKLGEKRSNERRKEVNCREKERIFMKWML